MKKKAQKSTRARHTGRINAFKRDIIKLGIGIPFSDRMHKSARVGNSGGRTNVRV